MSDSPYTVRVLPPEEWDRLSVECPSSPLAGIDLSTAYGHLLVIEREGRIIGHWPLFLVWHAEPLYIEEPHRTRGSVRALVAGLQAAIAELEIPLAFAFIEEPAMAQMAERLGFTPVGIPVYHAKAPDAVIEHLDVAAIAPPRSP